MGSLAATIVVLLIAVTVAGCRITAPDDPNEAIAQMTKYSQRGHPENAIKVAEDWLQKHPNNVDRMGTMYGQMAITYLIWASKDNVRKEERIQQAVAYYEKEISVRQDKPGDITFYDAGRGMEMAGDYSTANRCSYYGKAIVDLQKEIPYIQGESISAYGKTLPLAPVRSENERALERVKSKFEKAGCKTES